MKYVIAFTVLAFASAPPTCGCPSVEDAIRELREPPGPWPWWKVAESLNTRGYRTSRGRRFTRDSARRASGSLATGDGK